MPDNNFLDGDWFAETGIRVVADGFPIYNKSRICIARVPDENMCRVISRVPELYDYLLEAAYEYCFNCFQANGHPITDSDELVKHGCPENGGKCFVQRWLKILGDIRNEVCE